MMRPRSFYYRGRRVTMGTDGRLRTVLYRSRRPTPMYRQVFPTRSNRAIALDRGYATRIGASNQQMVKLIYSDRFSITGTTVGSQQHVFRGNSLFDPDLTSTGHQPLYFDQWATIYNDYLVSASKIELRVENKDSDPALVKIVPSNNTSPLTNTQLLEVRPAVTKEMSGSAGS